MITSMVRENISNLPCFRDVSDVAVLPGGLTNQNFKVTDAIGSYVVRFPSDVAHLGIDREVELSCLKNAQSIGVAPHLIYSDTGVLVTSFVEGASLTDETANRRDVLYAVVNAFKQLHVPLHDLHGRIFFVSPYRSITEHIRTIRKHIIPIDGDIEQYSAMTRKLYSSLPPFVPVLCHADLVGGNVIFDGQKAWLIDWEYAGMGDPLFDLGWFAVANNLSEDSCRLMLESYYGKQDKQTWSSFNAMRILCALRDALWGVVQTHGSALDLDYGEHARKYFAVYEELIEAGSIDI